MHYETMSMFLYHRTLLGNALTVNHQLTGRSGRQTKCKGLLPLTATLGMAAQLERQHNSTRPCHCASPAAIYFVVIVGETISWSLEILE